MCVLLYAMPMWAHATNDDAGVLVLGRISDDPKRHYQQLRLLLDYVVPRMRHVGIREGRILMAKDAQQMASYLRRGRVDWVSETAGASMLLQQRTGAIPMLLTERNGASRYRTVFFTRADSPIRDLNDLRGHSIAFQNTVSTSAYFVPAMEVLSRGIPLEILLSPMDKPDANSLGYVFGRTELNIATWVHKRLVDVGTMSDLDWDDPERLPAAYKRDMRVLYRTEPFPRALEMVRADLDPAVREGLRQVLLDAAADPEAGDVLLRYFQTTRFLEIDPATAQSLDVLREGVNRIGAEVE